MTNSEKNISEDYFLKLQLEKLDEVLYLKELNDSLLDLNQELLERMISLYRKNNISLDVETKTMISNIKQTLHSINSATNRKFTGEGIHRRLYRALKQYSYKVLVPYLTVW